MAEAGEDAPHKRRRLSNDAWIARQLAKGKKISPLFSIPCFTTDVFRRDWLHNSDQGVAADFMGNLFYVFLRLLPGRNVKERRKALLANIRTFYTANGVKDRLVGLKSWGIKAPKKPPKLKSSAAACRALVPFAHTEAQRLLDATDPRHAAMISASRHLLACYECLHKDSLDWREILPNASRDFAIQCDALRAASTHPKHWVIKPKMHQFLEMCSSGSKPNMSWTYRDEDYGGSIAQLCRIKGGCWRKVATYSLKMLTLFKTLNDVPRIV